MVRKEKKLAVMPGVEGGLCRPGFPLLWYNQTPAQLKDVTTFQLITKALVQKEYSKKDIHKVMGGNFFKDFKSWQRKIKTICRKEAK